MKKTILWFSVLFLGAARLAAWNSAPPATASVGATSATVSASTTAPGGFVPRVVMLWVKDPPASGGAWHVLNTAAGANGAFLTVSGTYTFSHGPGPYVWQVNYADGGAPPAPPGGTLLAGSGPTTTNVSQPNVAPTVSAWPALPANPLYVGANFTAQAIGSDTDGNLYSIFVDLSTNGGAWTPFAYNGAAPPNGNGFSSTSDGNVWTAGPVGTTYQFRAQATDQLQVSSPWQATAVYTVANRPPTVSWSVPPPTPLLSGTNFTAQASGTDPDANLGVINVDLSINGGAWTAFAYNDATKNGTRSSTISDGNVLTAGPAGTTYQFRAQTIDLSGASSAWLSTAVYTVTQANVAPSITTQPVSATVNQGQTASFTVVATGTPAPTYQWRKSGMNISGATSATLTITNAQPADAGSYDVVVTNSSGTVISNTVTLTVNVPPAITTQPVSAAVNQGQTATFTVVATGTPAPTYQWRKSGVNIIGATSSALTISNAQLDASGSYSVVVSNSAGTVTSNVVTLTVNPIARAITISAPATVNAGQTISIPTSAVTNVGGGEVIGHYHIEYSVNGGGSWTAFAFDAWDPPATGPTSVTRTPTITAGAYGSVIKVRVRVSFRRGAAGDVDYTGNPMDWGKWTNWDTPPTVYASIPVSSEPAQPLFTATAATGTYVLDATVQKLGASATSFGDGVIVEVFKRSPGVPDFVLWSSLLARPNAGHLARVNLKASLAAGESLSYRRIAHTADTTDDLITFTGAVKVANIVQVRNDIAFTTNPTVGKTALLRGLIDTAQNSFTAGVDRVEILVPAGDYYLDDVAYGGENLTNNDKNLLSISHDNITLRGAGTGPGNNTRLIAKGTNRILVDVNGASNVNLENLIFDFEQPALTFVQGNVTGMNPGTKTITADLDWLPGDTTPFNSTYVDGNGPHYPDLLVHGYSAAGLFLNYGAFGTDTANLPTFGTNPATGRPTVTVTFTFDPATVFTTPIPVAPAQQDRMVLRYSGSPFPGQSVESALRFNGTTDCEVNNVTLRASQNLAMICRGTNGMHFNLYTIERAPTISGTPVNRQISTIKDAIHYQGGVRGPTVESCRFDGLGDDALNIYATRMPATVNSGGGTFVSWAGAFFPGDVAMCFKGDYSAAQTGLVVQSVSPGAPNSGTEVITVSPSINDPGYNFAFNLSRSGEGFLIRYSEFGAFRGFGVREQTSFGFIASNLFTGTSGSPISFENLDSPEGPFPSYVKVQGNSFSGSGYGLYGGVAIRGSVKFAPVPAGWNNTIAIPAAPTDPDRNIAASPMILGGF